MENEVEKYSFQIYYSNMVNTKSAMGKKRSATTKIQSKPAKAAKTEEPVQEVNICVCIF